eukprot:TRINITY_DN27792_c0_g1_i1.p1 TRINITY_DN27792_c0_g1~~TRINITY_DN27792_c0_g1_i1.p1  ORF type:complete len:874 (-),score=117.22 TRINITY_DN27792_c0_g1_i1:81-2543(-)
MIASPRTGLSGLTDEKSVTWDVGCEPRGHYDLLRIPREAVIGEVRTAFRRQALRTHPDKGGDPEDFRRVVAAFDVLSDEAQRSAYDRDLDCCGCTDGRGKGGLASSSAVPAGTTQSCPPVSTAQSEADERLARGLARVLHLELVCDASDPSEWGPKLRQESDSVLHALVVFLSRAGGRIAKDANQEDGTQNLIDTDEAEQAFPREIPPPDGLPQGWKCIEQQFLSGSVKGQVYKRFTSPWGKKTQSVREAIKADADYRGEDGDAAVLRWEKQKMDQQKADHIAAKDMLTQSIGRGIYSTRASSRSPPSYWVRMIWSNFVVRTASTTSLAEAVDWHIAIAQMKAASRARLMEEDERGTSSGEALTEEALKQLVRTEPDVILSFATRMNVAGFRQANTSTPTTHDIVLAMRLRRHYLALLERKASESEFAKARVWALAQVEKKSQEHHRLRTCLAQMIRLEIRHRLRPTLATPISKATSRLPSAATEVAPAAISSSSSSQRSDDDVALELQDALGLDEDAAVELAQFARSLSQEELRKRLAWLRDDVSAPSPRPALRRPLDRTAVLPLTQAGEGRALQPRRRVGSASQVEQQPPLSDPPPASLRCRRRRYSASPRVGTGGGADTDAAEADLSAVAARRPSLPPSPPPAPPLRRTRASSAGFFLCQNCADIAPITLSALMPSDLSRFRATSVGHETDANAEIWRRFRDFKYTLDTFDAEPRRSRSGRWVPPKREAVRRLLGFLTMPSHFAIFKRLDLTLVPNEVLESRTLHNALGRMPHLAHVVLPWEGWSTSKERGRFLAAVPRGVAPEGWGPPRSRGGGGG